MLDVLSYIKKTYQTTKQGHKSDTKELRRRHEEIEHKIDSLVDLMIDGRIPDDVYQKKHVALKNEQIEILEQIKEFDNVDTEFTKKFEHLVKVAYGADSYFTGSEIESQRKLLKYVFQNLKLRGKKLEYSMTYPFSEFQKMGKNGEWCAREDSNP